MPKIECRDLTFEYDAFGDPSGRPLLLVMGLGAQMTLWDEGFCNELADRGHHVVRFDNRDVGLSSKFGHAGIPDVMSLMAQATSGEPVDVPYTLDDMADDAAGVLEALGMEDAHVCGASMGGMIVQTLAIRHPQRLRSLTSVMSTTGNPAVPPATPEAMAVLLGPPPASRDEAIERSVTSARVIGSPGFPVDEARIRERAAANYDRSFYPEGAARQFAAIVAHGNRVEALRTVAVPTLVIHGTDDPLVSIEGGRDTAASIPGARLLEIEGMGHDLPVPAWGRLADAIAEHTRKAEAARA